MLALMLTGAVSAGVYDTYSYNYLGNEVAAPDSYYASRVVSGGQLGAGDFASPSDIVVDENNNVYVLDSGNSRVVVFDSELRFVRSIDKFLLNNEPTSLLEPSGLFVKNNRLYISDTENGRVLICDFNGNVERTLTRPEGDAFPSDITYKPARLVVDNRENVYVLCNGVYYGAVMYNGNGGFEGFYGSNKVEMTFSKLADYTWKQLLNLEQRRKMQRFLPVEYNSIDIDQYDMIYVCSPFMSTKTATVRKLNPKGVDILNTKEFGDLDETIKNKFMDVAVDQDGFISCLDGTYMRIFQYDREGNLLFIFGRSGGQSGTFVEPIALCSWKDGILVLDRGKRNITLMQPTAFGATVREAVKYYNAGQFEKATGPWERVLKENSGLEMAYLGLGKNLYFTGNYKKAAAYFRMAGDTEWNSKAFKEYRSQWLRKNFSWILTAPTVCAFLLMFLIWKKSPLHRPVVQAIHRVKIPEKWMYFSRTLIHPIDGYEDIRTKSSGSIRIGSMCIVLAGISMAMRIQYTGFRFNTFTPETVNMPIVFIGAVGIILLFTVANWSLCVLFDSEAYYKGIFICTTYSLFPFVISNFITTLMSYVLCSDESVILTFVSMVGSIWSVTLLFFGMKETHQYSAGKTLWSLLLTLVGILLMLFLLFMASSLLQQMISFVKTLVSELTYRTKL